MPYDYPASPQGTREGQSSRNPMMQTHEDLDPTSKWNMPGSAKWWNDSLFPEPVNPADSAMPYLDQIEGKSRALYDPYIQYGNNALPTLQQQYEQLLKNPGGLMQQIGSGFQESPGYKFQTSQAMNASNNAASAGGMLGTPQHQFDSASRVNDLANQDYYNYLSHGEKAYETGLSGFQGMADQGYNASNELAQRISDALMSQANLAYEGSKSVRDQEKGIMGTIGGIVGGVVGGYAGGPAGASAGMSAGKSLG